MRNTGFSYLIAITILITGGCKKDPPAIPVEQPAECEPIHVECEIGPIYETIGSVPAFPCYHPSDPALFIFYSGSSIYKFNLANGEKTLLASDLSVIERMDWGAAGWITFSSKSWKIWAVKDDGSAQVQLSHTPRDLSPTFSPDGDRIIYARDMVYTNFEIQQNPSLVYNNKMMIVDLMGNAVDSICLDNGKQCKNWTVSSWNEAGLIAHVDGEVSGEGDVLSYGISSYNTNSMANTALYFSFSDWDKGEIVNIEWHPDGRHIYFVIYDGPQGGSIRLLDIESGEVQILKEYCDKEFYTAISISPDGKHLLAQKGKSSFDGVCTISTEWSIVRMDALGKNELTVELTK